MFLMLAGITLALFAIGFRISQVITSRSGGGDGGDWMNPIEKALQKAADDEHPLLDQEDRRRE